MYSQDQVMRCNTTMVLCVTYTILILSITFITHSLSLSTSTGTAKVSLQQSGSDTQSDFPQIQPKIPHPRYTQGPKYSGQNVNSVKYSVPLSLNLINKWKSTAQGRKKNVGISEGQVPINALSYDSSHTYLTKSSRTRKPSLPDLEVSLTSAHVYTPTDVSKTPSHTTPASTYSSPTQPSPLYTIAFTLLNETTKNYTSLGRHGKPIPVANSKYLYTNSYHKPTKEIPGM